MAAVDHGRQGARNTLAVTPSDTTDLPFVTTAIYVGGAGTGGLTIIDANGNTTLFAAVPAGTTIPVYASRIKATGTGVTSIVAIW
jgi:hypothetical protein